MASRKNRPTIDPANFKLIKLPQIQINQRFSCKSINDDTQEAFSCFIKLSTKSSHRRKTIEDFLEEDKKTIVQGQVSNPKNRKSQRKRNTVNFQLVKRNESFLKSSKSLKSLKLKFQLFPQIIQNEKSEKPKMKTRKSISVSFTPAMKQISLYLKKDRIHSTCNDNEQKLKRSFFDSIFVKNIRFPDIHKIRIQKTSRNLRLLSSQKQNSQKLPHKNAWQIKLIKQKKKQNEKVISLLEAPLPNFQVHLKNQNITRLINHKFQESIKQITPPYGSKDKSMSFHSIFQNLRTTPQKKHLKIL